MQRRRGGCQRTTIPQRPERFQVFNLDHESPSLRHEQIALEEYTVTANYGCVNIWTAKILRLLNLWCVGFVSHPSHLLQ